MSCHDVLLGNHNESLMVITDEHAHLVFLMEGLSYSLEQKLIDHDGVATILKDILEETGEHFMHEEDLMLETGYPGYLDHQKDHRRILDLIEDLIKRCKAHAINVEIGIRRLIEQWMSAHFEKFDRDLIVLVSEKY